MQVKRIVAPDMRSALEAVKEELGPDAIILSNKRTSQGIELLCTLENTTEVAEKTEQDLASAMANATALKPRDTTNKTPLERAFDSQEGEMRRRAEMIQQRLARKRSQMSAAEVYGLDDEPPQVDEMPARQPRQESASAASSARNTTRQSSYQEVDPQQNQELDSLRRELANMRQMFQQQWEGMGWQRFNEQSPMRSVLWRRLSRIGLQPMVIKQLLANANLEHYESKQAWQQVLDQMMGRLTISQQNIIRDGGIHAFVGPTGVGKTTTIGKLAARYVLAHGNEGVALVTTDTYRIAAHEQLKAVGRILEIPVKVVEKPEQLPEVLQSLRHYSLVLIDTAGVGADHQAQSAQLSVLAELQDRVDTWLLLSATAQYSVLDKSLDDYQAASLKGCVLTKLDESASMGELLSLLLTSRLPISYIANGQQIPDDLHAASARSLVKEALLYLRSDPDDEVLAMDFAEISSMNGRNDQQVGNIA